MFGFPTCVNMFRKSGHLQKLFHKCEALGKNIYPKKIYRLPEALLDELGASVIEIAGEKMLLNNLAVPNFFKCCMKRYSLIDTEASTFLGEHEPIVVYVTSNLLQEPIFI